MLRFGRVVTVMTICLAMLLLIAGCGGSTKNKDAKIGVSMPNRTLQRWNQDSEYLEKNLRDRGYKVFLEFADNDAAMQKMQLQQMIDEGCKILVVTAVNTDVLTDVLEVAKDNGVKVIAYDRLLMNTDAVDFYASFDNITVGTMQGEFIAENLSLKNGAGPYKMEIFAGSLDDNNSRLFFEGAMDVLRPYIKSGQLIVKSGQKDLVSCATLHWQEYIAKARMTLLLSSYYTNDKVDVVLCANDSTAMGVQTALKEAGYGMPSKKMPIITGQDADKKNVVAIINGEQSMTVFKDTRILAEHALKMIDAMMAGKEPETNDIGNYDNGVKSVPSFLIRPQVVTKANYRELLIDSGYYTEKDLQINLGR